jgi:hypothetical protein
MSRRLYRLLIRLHPPRFHDRFGEEMLCIFDESTSKEKPQLFSDGFLSLARQWLIRSGAWKLVAGLGLSSLFLFGWAYSFTRGVNWSLRRALEMRSPLDAPKRTSVLDRVQFSREAAQAVEILARIRRAHGLRRHSDRQPERPSGPLPTHRNPAKES